MESAAQIITDKGHIIYIPFSSMRSNICRFSGQRIMDKDKVNEIVHYQLDHYKKNQKFNYIGNITLIHFKDKYYLCDGQHRCGSLEILFDVHSHDVRVLFEIIDAKTECEIKQNFELINKNTPLPDIDFSEMNEDDHNALESVVKYFKNKFPTAAWSTGRERSKRPFINFNYFQEACRFIINNFKDCDKDKIIERINEYNHILSERNLDDWLKYKKSIKSPWIQRAKEWGVYFGLFAYESERTYIFEWARLLVEHWNGARKKSEYINKDEDTVPKRKNVSKTLRATVWNSNINNFYKVYCICCNSNVIDAHNYECGHVISHYNGGHAELSNLLPICSLCNKSMSVTNMEEFVVRDFPENIGNFKSRIFTQSALAGSVIADSALAGSALAGSAIADSALAGSAIAGSAIADSALADSALADSALADSALADSALASSNSLYSFFRG